MAPHDRTAQAEERSPLRLPNKIADSDPNKNQRIRKSIAGDVNRRATSFPCFFHNISILTNLLPSHWKKLPPELKQFVDKEMFDPVMRQVLEDDHIINWAPSATRLYPLITTGDGNCLLHAISLAMWGIEDEDLVLRNLLHEALSGQDMQCRKRWQRERKKLDETIPGSGLRYDTMEWRTEWEMVVKLASAERRPASSHGLPYECLEEFHVFMLANILRRPIIVMAQHMWHDLQGHSLQPQYFSGIYLPLKWHPEECYKHPIILGYYQMHFVPLVYTAAMDGEIPATDFVVPLVNPDHSPLMVHFLNEDEVGKEETLIQDYLLLEEISHMDINESMASAHSIQGAKLSTNTTPDATNLMLSYFKLVESHYRFYLEREYNPQVAARCANRSAEGQLQDKMSKLNVKSSPHSDMWAPASNPNYKSNMQAYTHQDQLANEISQPQVHSSQGQAADEFLLQQGAVSKPHVIHSMLDESCKTQGCPYYRSVSTGEYCHECYNKRKTSVAQNTMPIKCRTEGCLNTCEPGREHCLVCQASAKFQDSVESVTAPSAPLPSNVVLPSKQIAVCTDALPVAHPQTAKPFYESVHTSSGEEELTTLVVNTVNVGIKKCVMPECRLTGHPATNDMCKNCFEENRKILNTLMVRTGCAELEHQPDIPQEITKISSPSGQIYRQYVCRMQGCVNLGNPHSNGYCVECSNSGVSRPDDKPYYYQQSATASPQSIPPPNYSQAVRMLQNNLSRYPNAPQASTIGYAVPHDQNNKITVKKHICSSPGCMGIRLDTGYCWECESKNTRSPTLPRTQTPPPTPKQSWSTVPVPRSKTPPVPLSTATRQLNHLGIQHGNKLNQATTTKTGSLSHPATRTCRHPKCNHPAAPPKYILCDECIQVAELYKENTEQKTRNQAEQGQEIPIKMAPGKKIPAIRALVPRLKCQARGGCKDDMYGDPELRNLCSSCFTESLKPRPLRKTSEVYSAPVKQSPRHPQRQQSYSQVIPSPARQEISQNQVVYVPSQNQAANGNQVVISTRPSQTTVQVEQVSSYQQKCATFECFNAANPNILEGYCNKCYRVYNDVFTETREQELGIAPPAMEPTPAVGQSASTGYGAQGMNLPTPKPMKINCKHRWCLNYGNPRCFGYCNECYKIAILNENLI